MCLGVQADPELSGRRRCHRTHADAVVQRLLPRLLLAVGDVLGMIISAMTVLARTLHRITPGRSGACQGGSAPRKPDRIKPHVRLAYKG